MLEIYGIPNCDTMRKARRWLNDHSLEYRFHDYKTQGIEETLLHSWIAEVGWEKLLNRRGMMWRKLSQEQRDNIDQDSAIKLMLETPSIIKRPVLVAENRIMVGFSEVAYQELIQ